MSLLQNFSLPKRDAGWLLPATAALPLFIVRIDGKTNKRLGGR